MPNYDNLIQYFDRGRSSDVSTVQQSLINDNLNPGWLSKKQAKQARVDGKLARLQAEGALLNGQDDGDSSQYLRYEGIDTPETFHELDLHNEKTKMAKQYMYLHPEVSPQEAYATVEGQYEAHKIAQEQGQDISQMITDYRAQGLIDDSFGPTAFDINQAGMNATRFAKQYDQDNLADATTGFSAAGNLVDGSTGHFGRYMVNDQKYTDASIEQGYAAPGSNDSFDKQLKQTAAAKNKKLGNYATATGAKVMDAIIQTSSTKRFLDPTMKSTGETLHYESPEEFQFQVGAKIADGQLERDTKTGKYYEEVNGKRVEVHPDDVSSMYVAKNKTGESTKLGVARSDLKPEMWEQYGELAPMIARYMDKSAYDPYTGSPYKAKEGETNPETGGPALGYDGTPGPEGIDVNDPNAAVIYMRKAQVDDLEKYVHTHGGQVEARTAGSDALLPGSVSAALDKRFGAGTSEYTKSTGDDAAPLFNDQYDMNRVSNITDDLKAEPMPSNSKTWEPIKALQKSDPDAKIVAADISTGKYGETPTQKYERLYGKQDAEEGGFINAAKAFTYMAAEGVINTVDLIPEIGEYAFKNMFGDGQDWSDTKGFYDDKDSENFKEWIGYNDTVVNELGKDAVTAVKNAYEKGDYWGLGKVVWEGIKTPELVASSLGYVVGMTLPGGLAKAGVQVASGVNKAAKAAMAADKTGKLTKAKAIADAEEKAGAGYKIASIMAGNSGYVAEAEQFGREAESLYKETYGEEMPMAQKIAVRPLGLLYAKLDAVTAKAILLGKDPVSKAIPGAIKNLPDAMKTKLLGKLAIAAGAPAAKVTGAFGLEMLTEGVQTTMEKVAGEYKAGEVGVLDVAEKNKYEIGGGSLLGGAGGAQMSLGGVAKDVVGGRAAQLAGDLKNKAKDLSSKASDVVGGAVSTAAATKEAMKNNPNLNGENFKKAYNEMQSEDTVNYMNGDDNIEKPSIAADTDIETHIAAVQQMHNNETKTYYPNDDDIVDTQDAEAMEVLAEAGQYFDESYDKQVVGIVRSHIDAFKQDPNGNTDEGFTAKIATGMQQAITQLQEVAVELKEAGAGPKKMQAVNRKIARLVPMASASNIGQLDNLINDPDIDADVKVNMVLGSSKASIENIKAIRDSGTLTPQQEAKLDAKEAVIIIDANEVSKQKLNGGGVRLGATQWASLLKEGIDNSDTIAKITDFVAGQRSKNKKFTDAIAKWDSDNKMPWTEAGKDTEFKKTAKFQAEGFSADIKADIRATKKDTIEMTIEPSANGNRYTGTIGKLAALADKIDAEQIALEKLQELADSYAPSESQKGTKEAQTPSTDTNTQPEVKEAPEASIEDINEAFNTAAVEDGNASQSTTDRKAELDKVEIVEGTAANKAVTLANKAVKAAKKVLNAIDMDDSPLEYAKAELALLRLQRDAAEASKALALESTNEEGANKVVESRDKELAKIDRNIAEVNNEIAALQKATETKQEEAPIKEDKYGSKPSKLAKTNSKNWDLWTRNRNKLLKEISDLKKYTPKSVEISAKEGTVAKLEAKLDKLLVKPKAKSSKVKVKNSKYMNDPRSGTMTEEEINKEDDTFKKDPVKVKEEDAATIAELDKDYVSPDIDYAAKIAELDAKEAIIPEQEDVTPTKDSTDKAVEDAVEAAMALMNELPGGFNTAVKDVDNAKLRC